MLLLLRLRSLNMPLQGEIKVRSVKTVLLLICSRGLDFAVGSLKRPEGPREILKSQLGDVNAWARALSVMN